MKYNVQTPPNSPVKESPVSVINDSMKCNPTLSSQLTKNDELVQLKMPYSDFNAAFGMVPSNVDLLNFDTKYQNLPNEFYGFVCLIVSSCRLSVFPLCDNTKEQVIKFLDFEHSALDSVNYVKYLPNNKEIFGYMCRNKTFQRVELNSSTIHVVSFDSGESLGALNLPQVFELPDDLKSQPSIRIKLALLDTSPPENRSVLAEGKTFVSNKVLGKIVKVKNVSVFSSSFVIGKMYSVDGSIDYNKMIIDSGYALERKSNANSQHNMSPNSRANFKLSKTPLPSPPAREASKITSRNSNKIFLHNSPMQESFENTCSKSSKIPSHVPPAHEPFDMYPIVVISPELIWAQVFHDQSGYLEKLLEDLNSIYQGMVNTDYVPVVGEVCAAKYVDDGIYYRAEIIRVNNNGSFDVQFVDYGNKETIPLQDIHQLQSSFLIFPKQALCFGLQGISPANDCRWSDDASRFVRDAILQQRVSVKTKNITNNKLMVLIKDPSDSSKLINDELVIKGLAKKTVKMNGVEKIPKVVHKIGRGSAFNYPVCQQVVNSVGGHYCRKFSPLPNDDIDCTGNSVIKESKILQSQNRIEAEKSVGVNRMDTAINKPQVATQNEILKYNKPSIPNMKLPLNSKLSVIVVHIESPQLFYVISVYNCQDLAKLSESIQSHPHKMAPSVNIDDYYVAKYIKDNCFGRVKILKLKPGKALLKFVDYGNKQPVLINDVFSIEPQFCSLPQQAVPCSLIGIDNVKCGNKWSPDNVEYFTNLVINRKLEMTVEEIRIDNIHHVKLILDSAEDVATNLMKHMNSNLVTDTVCISMSPVLKCSTSLKSLALVDQSAVVISNVTSLSEFYIHLYNSETQSDIKKVILPPSEFNFEPFSVPLPNGTLCCAKFAEDGNWYRANITETSSNGDYTVHFIDFGNYSTVAASDVAVCPETLCSVPALAVKCSLYNAPQSSVSIMEQFKVIAMGKILVASVVARPSGDSATWCVSLIDTSGSNDVDIVSCLKLNNQPSPLDMSISSSTLSTPSLSPEKQSHFSTLTPALPSVVVTQPSVPKIGVKMKIILTEITSPLNFYVEFLTDEYIELFIKGVQSELPMAYSNPSQYAGFKANVGAYCCAKFSQDNCWYRCQVMKLIENKAKIFYIDYGNVDLIPIDQLYHLDSKFASVPAQAVLCSLDGICSLEGSSWSQSCINYMKTFVSDPLYAIVKSVDNNTVKIDLYTNTECTKSISNSLIENGFAKSISYCVPPCTLQQGINVVVSNVISFSSVYIQDSQQEVQKTLATLQLSLTEYAKSCSVLIECPQVNDYCCALFLEDGCWYRAKITKVMGKQVEVVYVDFGNSAVVDVVNVKPLTEELAQYPQLACPVALSKLGSISNSFLPFFKNLVEGQILKMKIVNNNCEPIEIELQNVKHNVNINEQVVAKSSSMTNKTNHPLACIDVPHIPVKTEFNAMIIHVDSLKKFYIQVTETSNVHVLMKLAENISTLSSSAPPLDVSNVHPGQLCLALFSGDYYRGRILEVSGKSCRVYFIDFGNTDLVNCSNMKVIPTNLLTPSAQAIQCSLVGISGSDVIVSSEEIIKMFASFVRDVEVKCCVINRHPLIVDIKKCDSGPTVCQLLGKEGMLPIAPEYPFIIDQSEIIDPPESITVIVTEVEKPNILWVQMYNKNVLTEFEKVTVEMNQYCNTAIPMDKPPLLGQLCCAKFNVDRNWYRGRIIDFDGENVKVRFVDFGNIQSTPLDSIRSVPKHLLDLPAQGIPCILSSYSDDISKSLHELYLNKSFKCIKKGISQAGLSLVDLFDPSTGIPAVNKNN